MAQIRIVAQGQPPSAPHLIALQRITGASLATLCDRFRSGEPLVECELFLNDFAEVAETLRALVRHLEQARIAFRIEEDGYPVTPETLANLLADSDEFRL